ncbi:hypothetical protein K443DRAFT_672866 [Laccaria amethystina LaAM-08-1]|uniref:Uncharacterized protein n=1 Tax=Laccaria amethystina LaAM-08-1 TaxID=1095629 RepID=A0A0C9X731_9AGAR|nr:hypothetical protein K443DRAFT_672866 [Laccaria amethystina LaAM-08-1]
MVQGKTKGLQTKESSARHAKKAAANMKKGRVVIAPKKTVLVKQAALQKNLTAKINKSIENQMVAAASAGKLTIMKNMAPEASSSSTSKSKGPAKPGK